MRALKPVADRDDEYLGDSMHDSGGNCGGGLGGEGGSGVGDGSSGGGGDGDVKKGSMQEIRPGRVAHPLAWKLKDLVGGLPWSRKVETLALEPTNFAPWMEPATLTSLSPKWRLSIVPSSH